MAATQQKLNCLSLMIAMATLLIIAEAKSAKQKPASAYFTICSRKNITLLNECVLDNINTLKPKLLIGIPELRLIPLDPLNIPMMELNEGEGRFRFKQTLNNLTIYGLRHFQMKSVDYKFDQSAMKVKMEMFTPSLKLTSNYVMAGQILVLPIKGDGDCELNFNEVSTIANVNGKIVKRNGDDYLDIVDVRWNFKVGGAKFQFNNLFNGDRLLGDATNNFLNENWKDAFETYKHLPEEAFGVVFKELTSQVFKRYTLKELFLE